MAPCNVAHCPVCLDDEAVGWVVLPCGHVLHEECARKALANMGSKCPTCRKKATQRGLLKIYLGSADAEELHNCSDAQLEQKALGYKQQRDDLTKKVTELQLKKDNYKNDNRRLTKELKACEDKLTNARTNFDSENRIAAAKCKQLESKLAETIKVLAERDGQLRECSVVQRKLEQEIVILDNRVQRLQARLDQKWGGNSGLQQDPELAQFFSAVGDDAAALKQVLLLTHKDQKKHKEQCAELQQRCTQLEAEKQQELAERERHWKAKFEGCQEESHRRGLQVNDLEAQLMRLQAAAPQVDGAADDAFRPAAPPAEAAGSGAPGRGSTSAAAAAAAGGAARRATQEDEDEDAAWAAAGVPPAPGQWQSPLGFRPASQGPTPPASSSQPRSTLSPSRPANRSAAGNVPPSFMGNNAGSVPPSFMGKVSNIQASALGLGQGLGLSSWTPRALGSHNHQPSTKQTHAPAYSSYAAAHPAKRSAAAMQAEQPKIDCFFTKTSRPRGS